MTPTFAALLCLGLILDLRTPVLTGTLPKPTIRADPGTVVPKGIRVTISCEGTSEATEYHLRKVGDLDLWQRQTLPDPRTKAQFLIPSTKWQHARQYYCSYQTPAGKSEPSDSLELVVTGIYRTKPQLSAQPSPVVASGENLSLHCVSQLRYDRLILTEEGEQTLPMSLDSQHISHWQSQALFPVRPVTLNSRRTFRCYGYYKRDPQMWSEPSDPLEIHISGSSVGNSTLPTGPILRAGLESYQKIRIGVSMAFLLLVFLLIFHLHQSSCQDKCRKEAQREITDLQHTAEAEQPVPRDRGPQKRSCPAAAIKKEILCERRDASGKSQQPEDSVELDFLNPPDENPRKEMYAQLRLSSIRRSRATSPSTLSRELLRSKDIHSEDREMDSKAAVHKGLQNVSYADLFIMMQRKSQLNPLPPTQRSPR